MWWSIWTKIDAFVPNGFLIVLSSVPGHHRPPPHGRKHQAVQQSRGPPQLSPPNTTRTSLIPSKSNKRQYA
ncbi:hypothetical protein FA15DRAFT_443254 [Coprinopsis marcescibilis]|uniref:Uncharacterized protein n=1 Tax=Coprinopsis marcescibilis TaxID=230819 RepID=A0A5C3KUC0_COPMA|nr:hypothetical protein FA15DRAFT_443254 [Coprinopsis marcescibilis]